MHGDLHEYGVDELHLLAFSSVASVVALLHDIVGEQCVNVAIVCQNINDGVDVGLHVDVAHVAVC